jgi:uncharacterized protein (DUF302 family)
MTTLLAEPELVVKQSKAATNLRVNPLVYDRTVSAEMDVVYKNIFTALENNGYFVLFESNIGKNLSHFAKRWGKDYNKNKLTSIRSMVFCNNSYANQISNIDPSMLAICPLSITFYSKNKKTHILFVRPGKVAAPSKAHKIAKELEDDVIKTIEIAIASL